MSVSKRKLMIPLDLPESLNPGRVILRPLSGYCWLLTACDICYGHSARAFIGACGHAFCNQCVTLPLPNLSEEQSANNLTLWCVVCQCKQDAELCEAGNIVKKMQFECLCGFEGNLQKIKMHFWMAPERGGHRAVPEEALVPFSARKEQVNAVQMSTNNNSQDGSVDTLKDGIQALIDKTDSLCTTGSMISASVQSLQQTRGDHGEGMLWINVRGLIKQHEETGEEKHTPLYKWESSGYSIGTSFLVEKINGSSWLGVSHRATYERVIRPFKPFNMCIRVRVRNLAGEVVEQAVVQTFRGGKAISEAFQKPLSDQYGGGYGVSNLISVEHLQRPNAGIITAHGLVNIQLDVVFET